MDWTATPASVLIPGGNDASTFAWQLIASPAWFYNHQRRHSTVNMMSPINYATGSVQPDAA